MVGLPGSGKTRMARAELQRRERQGRRGTLVRWSSDDQRRSMLDGPPGSMEPSPSDTESTILLARDAWLVTAIRNGLDVIVDDLNLDQNELARLIWLIQEAGGQYRIADFTGTPLRTCVSRDAGRSEREHVGSDRLHDLYERYLAPHRGRIPLLVRIKEAS
jgi:tRNA uridine 5-carbamoylmethylation protein Kti12